MGKVNASNLGLRWTEKNMQFISRFLVSRSQIRVSRSQVLPGNAITEALPPGTKEAEPRLSAFPGSGLGTRAAWEREEKTSYSSLTN